MSHNNEVARKDNVIFIIEKAIMTFGLCVKAKRIQLLVARFAHVCFVATLITQTIALFMAQGDTEKLFESFSVLTFCSMGALKIRSLRSYYERWFHFLSRLNDLEHEQLYSEVSPIDYESDGEDTNNLIKIHIKTYTDKFGDLASLLYKIYFFTCTIFVLTPFLECIFWTLKSVELEHYPHILPGWSPLDGVGIWGYLVTIMIELLSAYYTVIVHFVFDLMVFGSMLFLSGQFMLLRDLCASIAGTGMKYDITPRRNERAHVRIIRCHRILLTLEQSIFELEKLIRNVLGVYFLVAILTLCSVAIRLSSEEMSVMKVASLLQYTCGCLIQLFLFCSYGDMVLQKSSVGMGEGVYAAAWWRLSPRIRREAMLLGAWQARTRRLRAGLFNKLDLPSFILIVRAAYSYYAVLRK